MALHRYDRYHCGTKTGCRKKCIYCALKKVAKQHAKNYKELVHRTYNIVKQTKQASIHEPTGIMKLQKANIPMPSEQNSMTNNALSNDHVDNEKHSKDSTQSHDELVPNDDGESTDPELEKLLEFYNDIIKYDLLHWRRNAKNIGNGESTVFTQLLDTHYGAFKTNIHMPYDKDERIKINKEFIKKKLKRKKPYMSFSKYVSMLNNKRSFPLEEGRNIFEFIHNDPDSIYRAYKKQSQLHSRVITDRDYEKYMAIQNEINYLALKRQIQMQNDKVAKDPDNLYKTLNKKFKRPVTEDFFRDPIAACVEVLENFCGWIAEKLSLPPPAPVNYDLIIYKREEPVNNYSYLAAVVKNKKVEFLVSQGLNLNASNSYLFLNQPLF